jgi:hypothetical protein
MSEAPDSERFMSRVDTLLSKGGVLSPLAAGLVVAVDMGIDNSRGFARAFGVEHALVLREIALLAGEDGLLTVTDRHPRTLRTSLALSARGRQVLAL